MEIKEMRESLSIDKVKEFLEKYDVHSVHETNSFIQYPTACHNVHGGSHKLYYYKDSHMFKCYTECDSLFDIFELVQKMEELRGNEINLPTALRMLGFDPNDKVEVEEDVEDDRRSLQYYATMQQSIPPRMEYKGIENDILSNFSLNEKYLSPWIREGVTSEVLRIFDIRYDIVNLAIVIPHKDVNGQIIGIRGRFMAQDAPAKYMPLRWNGIILAHSLRGNLYGLYENKAVIQKSKTVIIFESEKSVLKFSSVFGHENNFSVATCGNKISNEQIQLLQDMGVKNVILAFDKDYDNSADRIIVQERYNAIANRLSVYFNASVLFDYGTLLGYKDAPIDRGKAVFEELFKYRYYM